LVQTSHDGSLSLSEGSTTLSGIGTILYQCGVDVSGGANLSASLYNLDLSSHDVTNNQLISSSASRFDNTQNTSASDCW
jgi:hypothetical protein